MDLLTYLQVGGCALPMLPKKLKSIPSDTAENHGRVSKAPRRGCPHPPLAVEVLGSHKRGAGSNPSTPWPVKGSLVPLAETFCPESHFP